MVSSDPHPCCGERLATPSVSAGLGEVAKFGGAVSDTDPGTVAQVECVHTTSQRARMGVGELCVGAAREGRAIEDHRNQQDGPDRNLIFRAN